MKGKEKNSDHILLESCGIKKEVKQHEESKACRRLFHLIPTTSDDV